MVQKTSKRGRKPATPDSEYFKAVEEGLKLGEMARRFDRHSSTILYRLQKLGISIRKPSKTDYVIALEDRLTVADATQRLNVSDQTVYNHWGAMGIKVINSYGRKVFTHELIASRDEGLSVAEAAKRHSVSRETIRRSRRTGLRYESQGRWPKRNQDGETTKADDEKLTQAQAEERAIKENAIKAELRLDGMTFKEKVFALTREGFTTGEVAELLDVNERVVLARLKRAENGVTSNEPT
jgi:transposase-like protein